MIEVAVIESARATVLIETGGAWVIQKGARMFRAQPDQIVSFVACLEEPIEELRLALKQGLLSAGLPAVLEESFPYAEIVTAALDSGSEKWMHLAVSWIETLNCTEHLRAATQRVLTRRAGTQRDRQRLMKWVRSKDSL